MLPQTRGTHQGIWKQLDAHKKNGNQATHTEIPPTHKPAPAIYKPAPATQGQQPKAIQATGPILYATLNASPASSPLSDASQLHRSLGPKKKTPTDVPTQVGQYQAPIVAQKQTKNTFTPSIPQTQHFRTLSNVPTAPFSPPTRQTCPPPTPTMDKQPVLTQDQVHEIVSKLTFPHIQTQKMTRSKSAELVMDSGTETFKVPARSNSGSSIGEGYCDAPSFDLGPEFDMTPVPPSRPGPQFDETPVPPSRPGPQFDMTPIPPSRPRPQFDRTPVPPIDDDAEVQILDKAEYNEMEKVCMKAERNYRTQKPLTETKKTEPGPKQLSDTIKNS